MPPLSLQFQHSRGLYTEPRWSYGQYVVGPNSDLPRREE